MIDLKKYFVKVSVKEKIITEGIQILPRCTKSISGFSFLPEEILENLTEYGFENTGYINKIGRAHVRTPVTEKSRMPSSA